MRKKTLILLAVLLIIILGGFFYFWYIWIPKEIEKEENLSKTPPPTLFSKDDYKIEERNGEKYVVIEKIGLTAKVPEGWKIEKKQTADIGPQYWVRLLSGNYKPSPRTVTIPGKGCRIDISAWISEDSNRERKQIIEDLKNGNKNSIEKIYPEEGYNYTLIDVDNYDAIEQKTSKDHILSEFVQAVLTDIPINKDKILTFYIDFSPSDKEICMNAWKEFLRNVEIK